MNMKNHISIANPQNIPGLGESSYFSGVQSTKRMSKACGFNPSILVAHSCGYKALLYESQDLQGRFKA